jgi:tRNA threonylcarbamoyl adenosine modification protein YeaZ
VLVLALDTSSPTIAVALCDASAEDVRVRAERTEAAPNRHGERLAPLIATVLSAAGVDPSDLEGVVAGIGPGPFTGLRVGVVTAAAMSEALRIPSYGVCSLDAIAHRFATGDAGFAVITDARRKQVYWARYDESGRRVEGPELGSPDDVARELAQRTTHVVGAGVLLFREAFAAFSMRDGDPSPRAADLAWAADLSSPGGLSPLYLRRPDATPPGRPKAVTPA